MKNGIRKIHYPVLEDNKIELIKTRKYSGDIHMRVEEKGDYIVYRKRKDALL